MLQSYPVIALHYEILESLLILQKNVQYYATIKTERRKLQYDR